MSGKKRRDPAQLLLPLLVLIPCSMRIGCVAGLQLEPADGMWGGLRPGLASLVWSGYAAIAALVFAVTAHLLRRPTLLRVVALLLMLSAAATEIWHRSKLKDRRREYRASVRRSLGLDDPMPSPADFRLRVENYRWGQLDPAVPELEVDGREWLVRYLHHDEPRPEKCVGVLRPSQAAELKQRLDAARVRNEVGEPLCAGRPGGEKMFRLTYSGAGGDWSWEASTNCANGSRFTDGADVEAIELGYLLEHLAPVSPHEERVVCEDLGDGTTGP